MLWLSPFKYIQSNHHLLTLVLLLSAPLTVNSQELNILDHTIDFGPDQVTLEWTSQPGDFYTFWQSTDLDKWQALERLLPADLGSSTTHTEAFIDTPTQAFFRVSKNLDTTPDLPAVPYTYTDPLPAHFTTNSFPLQYRVQNAAADNDNTPLNNPTTDAGATLGRVLFYDKSLSSNQTISCASCHQQAFGFSDPLTQSVGFEGGLTRRHSMALGNAALYLPGKFFWDERAATLEDQVLQPIQDPVEMGLTLPELEAVVSSKDFYPPLFEAVFGDPAINSDRISKALAQFVRSLVSANSRYDRARARVTDVLDPFPTTESTAGADDNFTTQENLGKDLFMRRNTNGNSRPLTCIDCHVSEAFVSPWRPGPAQNATSTTVNNGLDLPNAIDRGVRETTGNIADSEKFKMPSLRNIAVRPPYMHDGSLATLEEVVEHYSSGLQPHPNLQQPLLLVISEDPLELEAIQLDFTPEEKSALVAFLKTLTDDTLLTHEKYSDPFE